MSDPVVYRSNVRIERVMGFHVERCPVARTLSPCVAISTALEMEDV